MCRKLMVCMYVFFFKNTVILCQIVSYIGMQLFHSVYVFTKFAVKESKLNARARAQGFIEWEPPFPPQENL